MRKSPGPPQTDGSSARVRAAGAAGLVLAVGVAAFLLARVNADHADPDGGLPASGGDPDHTFSVDGRAHSCLSGNTVRLKAEVDGAGSATFLVDGVEVASERSVLTVIALLPGTVTEIPCDDGRTHRIEVITDHASGCRLSAVPNATFAEAKNHSMNSNTDDLPRGVCTLTIRD